MVLKFLEDNSVGDFTLITILYIFFHDYRYFYYINIHCKKYKALFELNVCLLAFIIDINNYGVMKYMCLPSFICFCQPKRIYYQSEERFTFTYRNDNRFFSSVVYQLFFVE